MSKLRVAVIGTGAFAEVCHVPGIQSHPNADLVVLCGRRPQPTKLLAQRMNISETCTSYEEICARPDIDAVTIVTPNVSHAPIALEALKAGKHVFCEKPLGVNVCEAHEMVKSAEHGDMVHQVGFTYRYLYGIRELNKRVSRGDIGVPHYARLQFDTWQGLDPNTKIGFRDYLALAGGGVLYDVGCHFFDLIAFIFGPIDAVTGFTDVVPRPSKDHVGELRIRETDDMAGAWFICKNGIQGQWLASRVSPPSHEGNFIEVIGREGALKASLSRGSVDTLKVFRPAHQAWESVTLPKEASSGKPHCLQTMMRNFVDACLRGKLDDTIDASFHDGLSAQIAIEAVQKASGQRNWYPFQQLGGLYGNVDDLVKKTPR